MQQASLLVECNPEVLTEEFQMEEDRTRDILEVLEGLGRLNQS